MGRYISISLHMFQNQHDYWLIIHDKLEDRFTTITHRCQDFSQYDMSASRTSYARKCTKPLVQRYKVKLTCDMCSNIYNQTFWIFHFLCGFGIFTHTKLNKKSKIKIETMHIKKCKMHKEMQCI